MKKKQLQELQGLQVDVLNKKIIELKKELANLYLEKQLQKLTDPRKIFHSRKHIAKILTIINSKKETKQ